jgi:predicted nucleic acid-binding protein
MIVVSNTSPLNYLALIDGLHVLPALYREIYVPGTVLLELLAEGSPEPVRAWAEHPPSWVIRRDPTTSGPSFGLHPGEGQAIALAVEIRAERILIDERRGVRVARANGLAPIGVLGVLDAAAQIGLIDLREKLDLLQTTNFRMTGELRDCLIVRDRKRPRGRSAGT